MDAEEKVAIAKRLIENLLEVFSLKISINEDGEPVLHDIETWYEVEI